MKAIFKKTVFVLIVVLGVLLTVNNFMASQRTPMSKWYFRTLTAVPPDGCKPWYPCWMGPESCCLGDPCDCTYEGY
jgi:hypothetical protein